MSFLCKLSLVLLIPASFVLAAGCNPFSSDDETGEIETYKVVRGSIRITIKGKGTLKAKNSTRVSTQIRSQAKIKWLVEEGTRVEKDDVLVELDMEQIDQRIQTLEQQVTDGESRLASAISEYENQKLENVKNIAQAELSVERAQKEREKFINGDAILAERQKKLAVEEAESAMNRAKEDYEQSIELLKEEFVTANQVEEERLKYQSAKVRFESAKLELELYKTYTHPMDLKQKEQGFKDSQTDLETTKKRAATTLRNRESQKLSVELSLKRTREQLKETVEEREHYTIKAPTPGLVIYGDPRQRRWGGDEDNVRVGGTLWGGQTIITLPDLSGFIVSMSVHEINVNKLKKDLTAYVKLESYENVTIEGKISFVATVAKESDWWNRDEAKQFEIEIVLNKTDQDFRPGVTANVEIFVEEIKDVIKVPSSAVYFKEGKHLAYVKDGKIVRPREIKLGNSNDNEIEITKGLSEGEEVLLVAPEFLEGTGFKLIEESADEAADEAADESADENEGEKEEEKPDKVGKPGKKPGKKPGGKPGGRPGG